MFSFPETYIDPKRVTFNLNRALSWPPNHVAYLSGYFLLIWPLSFHSVRTGLQRFRPLDPNAPVPGRIPSDSTSLSSLSLGGVPRQKFLLVTLLDKEVSPVCFDNLYFITLGRKFGLLVVFFTTIIHVNSGEEEQIRLNLLWPERCPPRMGVRLKRKF